MRHFQTSRLRVVLLDNDALSLRMMRMMLNQMLHSNCIWATTQPDRAIEVCVDKLVSPSVLLTDMSLDGISGFDICRHVRDKQLTTQFIGMTAYKAEWYIRHNHGLMSAIYQKEDIKSIVSEAVRLSERSAVGLVVDYPAADAQRLLGCNGCSSRMKAPLSPNELAIMEHYSKGLSTREIMEITNKTKGTIRSYELRALNKLGASNRTEAVAICVRMKLFS